MLPCGFLSEEEEEPRGPTPAPKPRTRQTPTQLDERPLYSDEDDEGPSFYPMEVNETEVRILESYSVPPSENVAAARSGTCAQTKLSHKLANISEAELEHQPMNSPEPSAENV